MFFLLDSLTGPINYYRNTGRYKAAHLPIISIPTLLVWGIQDNALSIEMSNLTPKYYENFTLKHVPDAGHFVHEERPETVNNYMREFLA